ncbi:MAG: DUF4236 domain-containing protein [Acidobacteriota bacterium]|nr:DUF4236 domain-containing protein [Acidobacteriota bacterium]
MAWRFRKSFKVLPGVRLNVSKKGLTSATIGKRGLSASVGKQGVHQNVGLAGTGLSYRSKIGDLGSFGPWAALGAVAVLLLSVMILCAVCGRRSESPEQTRPVQVASTPMPSITTTPTPVPMTKKRK